MHCNHDVNYLMGTADGIVCRKCGKVFPSLSSLHADLEADRAAQNAHKGGEALAAGNLSPEDKTATSPEISPKKRGRRKKEDAD